MQISKVFGVGILCICLVYCEKAELAHARMYKDDGVMRE